jgi:hypothetical protein
MNRLETTLLNRGDRYGPFDGQAKITQDLKTVIADHLDARGKALADDQQEALDMICSKIARIVNGDPDYDDNWIDIAQLVARRLQRPGS